MCFYASSFVVGVTRGPVATGHKLLAGRHVTSHGGCGVPCGWALQAAELERQRSRASALDAQLSKSDQQQAELRTAQRGWQKAEARNNRLREQMSHLQEAPKQARTSLWR